MFVPLVSRLSDLNLMAGDLSGNSSGEVIHIHRVCVCASNGAVWPTIKYNNEAQFMEANK